MWWIVKGMKPQFEFKRMFKEFKEDTQWVSEFQENVERKLKNAQNRLNELRTQTSEWNQGRYEKNHKVPPPQ
jgi:peptidoglycan hydrolase CwlO-like protein